MRVHLELDRDDEDLFAEAAALMGITMAGFVRIAAKEKARALIEQQRRDTAIPDCAGFDRGVHALKHYLRKWPPMRSSSTRRTKLRWSSTATTVSRCGADAVGLAALREVARAMRRIVL